MNITCLVWVFFLSLLTPRSTVELFMNIGYEIVCCLVREILKCRYFQILDIALKCIGSQFWKDSMSFAIKVDIYWKFNIEKYSGNTGFISPWKQYSVFAFTMFQ